jgi:hypothetical protein
MVLQWRKPAAAVFREAWFALDGTGRSGRALGAAMQEQIGNKAVVVAVRCSIYASCGCAVTMLFIWLSPRSTLGLSDDEIVRILEAAYDAARLLSILNTMSAIGMMARFREARASPWLWTAIASPLFFMLFTPAFNSA